MKFLFPSWAGVILRLAAKRRGGDSFPRMGGGDPAFLAIDIRGKNFSPHGRG